MRLFLSGKPKCSFNGETMNRLSAPRLGVVFALLTAAAWLGWAGGPTSPFDEETILRLTSVRESNPGLTSLAITLTWLGSAYVTFGTVLAASLWRFAVGDRATAIWAAGTVAGGRLV